MKRTLLIAAICLASAAACSGGEDGNNSAANNAATPSGAQAAKESIAAGLAASSDHGTLVQALKASGLDSTLSGKQPYTVFAPTDAAFAKLPSGNAAGLMAPESKAQLTELLAGHIVPGLVTASDLAAAVERGKGQAKLATVGGSTLVLTRDGDALMLAGPGGSRARVVGAERLQSNGAIHAVDGLLLPK
jgi:uncharacterized surface protein with fasciclin (FAS1) repeats